MCAASAVVPAEQPRLTLGITGDGVFRWLLPSGVPRPLTGQEEGGQQPGGRSGDESGASTSGTAGEAVGGMGEDWWRHVSPSSARFVPGVSLLASAVIALRYVGGRVSQ